MSWGRVVKNTPTPKIQTKRKTKQPQQTTTTHTHKEAQHALRLYKIKVMFTRGKKNPHSLRLQSYIYKEKKFEKKKKRSNKIICW